MTLPEELVRAATDDLMKRVVWNHDVRLWTFTDAPAWVAKGAVAAVLRALPESKAVKQALRYPPIFFVEEVAHAEDYWQRQAERLAKLADDD